MIIDTDNLLTVSGYAKKMNITATSVYNYIKSGKLKTVKVDNITLIILDDKDAK